MYLNSRPTTVRIRATTAPLILNFPDDLQNLQRIVMSVRATKHLITCRVFASSA